MEEVTDGFASKRFEPAEDGDEIHGGDSVSTQMQWKTTAAGHSDSTLSIVDRQDRQRLSRMFFHTLKPDSRAAEGGAPRVATVLDLRRWRSANDRRSSGDRWSIFGWRMIEADRPWDYTVIKL